MTFPQLLTELKNYPAGVWEELRRVTWPSPARVLSATAIVMVIAAISTGIVALFDVAFSQAIGRLL